MESMLYELSFVRVLLRRIIVYSGKPAQLGRMMLMQRKEQTLTMLMLLLMSCLTNLPIRSCFLCLEKNLSGLQ